MTQLFFHEVVAVQNARHRHRILGARLFGDRAEVRLVVELHVRVDHVEVALGHRQVAGLDDHQPGMMQARQLRHDLDQVFEILVAAVTPPAFEVAHERRTVDRRKHLRIATDDDAALGIARMLGKFTGCGLTQGTRHAALEAHARALDVGASGLPDFECARIVAELEADLLDDPVGLILEFIDAFLAEKFVERNLALDKGGSHGLRAFTLATATTAAGTTIPAGGYCVVHADSPRMR